MSSRALQILKLARQGVFAKQNEEKVQVQVPPTKQNTEGSHIDKGNVFIFCIYCESVWF